jgi:rhodanese-related sulfurtransferase
MTVQYRSLVAQPEAPSPEEAVRHFSAKLALETDPSDVAFDLAHGVDGFVVVDARSADAFADLHLRSAVSLPHARIDATTAAPLRDRGMAVVYCWSASCNAADKAARKLAALGIRVKLMIGGLEAWIREGYPTEGALSPEVPFERYLRYHHAEPHGPLSAAG